MPHVVVSSKYQIVIPTEIRNILGIKKGQRLHLLVEQDRLTLVPDYPIEQLRGYLRGMNTMIDRDGEDDRL